MSFHIIKSIKALDNMVIEAVFDDGTNKKYNMKPIIEKYQEYKKLKDLKIFKTVKVDIGGYGIIWGNELDLSSEEIWNNGQ